MSTTRLEKLKSKPKVEFDLTSVDGNAFSLMGHFMRRAKKQGWTQEEVDLVLAECQKGEYDHLVQTLIQFCI